MVESGLRKAEPLTGTFEPAALVGGDEGQEGIAVEQVTQVETSGRLGGVATVVYTNGRWGSRYNFNDSHMGLWTSDFGLWTLVDRTKKSIASKRTVVNSYV